MGWAGECKLGRYKKKLHEKVTLRLPTHRGEMFQEGDREEG